MCIKYVAILMLVILFYFNSAIAQVINLDEGLIEDEGNTAGSLPSLNFVENGNKRYYIGDVFQGNFFRSEQFCRQNGMNLVSISSSQENDFLQRTIIQRSNSSAGLGDEFWTSGTKIPDSRNWIWFTTGRKISYYNWLKGQPESNKNYQCIEAQVTNNQLKWSNKDCWEKYYFICESTKSSDIGPRVEYS
ncbi:snaclec alboaggregin-D subunit beta-like [Diabrotica virgifera virgifera]|uniref:C-type lectin domain-containing protein n=1 Tax=Diabrotica virgifera virgifera TaxID=50390 RepID=A0ABM5KNK8_DIAVI|nr:snaclec alboaggregin-D subunit beta-like [Diabrotica virgifera virgifera]